MLKFKIITYYAIFLLLLAFLIDGFSQLIVAICAMTIGNMIYEELKLLEDKNEKI